MNLFEKLVEDDGAAKSNSQLAAMTGADPVLLSMLQSSHFMVGYSCERTALMPFRYIQAAY